MGNFFAQKGSVELGGGEGKHGAGDHATFGQFIGNDKVFEVDKGRGDQAAQESHQSQRDQRGYDGLLKKWIFCTSREMIMHQKPCAQEGEAGKELDEEITNGNGDIATSTAAALPEPGNQRDVLIPRMM